ncbi:iron export ABC transporter permease subunit FetB [Orenia metallireducens]|uniref:Iron export ABC transporter permease subunit FetB n=1 Tax=Orenia metallireducens TaxID=1413210 RepID=A0A1C0A9C9_9FIRM|nr:iron export ABC transporter permease subunit FetB [Orenia metallireducens]OCL26877.1 iron export ABC transporter permease subunit FetB [Orenia metallireducens]
MEQTSIIHLRLWQLVAAYIFVLILLFFLKIRRIDREKELLLATTRMTLQLALVGYLLGYIFEQDNYLFTLIIIAVMEVFAIYNIYQRVNTKISRELKKIIAFSMAIGTLTSLLYFILVVIGLKPWYDPRYFIPLAGMLIGNSMTGISLGVERLISGMKENQAKVETALMLGATPKKATQQAVNDAFNSAILPTINSMMGMGIIFLPGMMTGQILSGVSPLTAIEYQIAIMLGILGSVSLTVVIFVYLGYKTFFNERAQLIINGYETS